MANYKLVYFTGCPNYLPAIDLLNQSGLEFKSICQDDLNETDSLKNYSSPTLLKGDKIIFGSKASGGGCSMPLPTKDELLRLINEH